MFKVNNKFEQVTRRITKDKNGENMPQLEITKVVFVHYDIVNNQYQ